MDATFQSIGRQARVVVEDNRGASHTITIDATGTIHEHETDAYATDPADRSPTENEHVTQARRYAQYALVSEHNEHQALPLAEHPGLIYTMYQTVLHASDEEFDRIFKTYGAQLASHGSDEIEPPVRAPRTLSADELLYYQIDLWLTMSQSFSQASYQQYMQSLSSENAFASLDALLTGDMMGAGLGMMLGIGAAAKEHGSEPIEMLTFAGRSNISPVVINAHGKRYEQPKQRPVDEPPVSRIELPPLDVGTREEFRELIAYHLLCRGRDTYLTMGIEPQEEIFKVVGPGAVDATRKYSALDMYEAYHDPDETITSWDPHPEE